MRYPLFAALPLVALLPGTALAGPSGPRKITIDVSQWRVIERDSGPDNYYTAVHDGTMPYIHAQYRPPEKTTVLGFRVPEDARPTARSVHWKWRAITLPRGGNECDSAKADSAAVVYLTWKRGLRYYTLKYVWSSEGRKGQTCDQKRNPFTAQDTIILESGGPLGAWRSEEIDLRGEFRRHFENGDPNAEVPDFLGVGIMSDGDQTQSDSAADYADFSVDY